MDPSYIISLIRKLLPTDVTSNNKLPNGACNGHSQGLDVDNMEESATPFSTDSDPSLSRNLSGRMDIVNDVHEFAPEGRESGDSCNAAGQPGHNVSLKEEVWEEYGCILWDLAATKSHAELMVLDIFLCLFFNVSCCYLGSFLFLCYARKTIELDCIQREKTIV